MTSVRMSIVWAGVAFALNSASLGPVRTMPRFSATKTRPPGANEIAVGDDRPVTIVSSTKPDGIVSAATTAAVRATSAAAERPGAIVRLAVVRARARSRADRRVERAG